MNQPLIVTVILNTNRCEDTLATLESLDRNTYSRNEILILDNASVDGSVQAIKTAFPKVEIFELEENLGYAGNNNVGIKIAIDKGAEWVFVLNEDTILAPECLSSLIDVGERETDIGIVGPMVYHYDEPEVIQSAGGKIGPDWSAWHLAQNDVDHGQYKVSHEVDWISGCAIMVRREVIDEIGMLDERFFYYWEETEWCLRAKKSGWKIVQVPQAKLWHKGVQQDYEPSASVTYYNTRNRLLMLSKHQAPVHARLVAWEQIARTMVSWSIKPKWRTKHEHRNAILHGALDFLRGRWGNRAE